MKKKGSRLSGSFIPVQFIYILSVYLLALLFFAFFRFLFQWNFSENFLHDVTAFDILKSYFIGIRFDQILILLILAPILLLTPWFSPDNKITRRFTLGYLGLIFPFCFIVMLADIRFFSHFNSRLNFLAYEYLFDSTMAQNLIYTDIKFWLYICLWILLSALFIWLVYLFSKKTAKNKTFESYSKRIIWFVIFTLLFATGIRGRFSLAPMDWGIAYFSSNHTLNQSALNGIYTLARNYLETSHDPRLSFLNDDERFLFVDKDITLKEVQQHLQQPNIDFIEPEESIKRTVTAQKKFAFEPNIIIVIMESWSGKRTSSLGDTLNLTPAFDSIANNGMLFTNFYANGTRTNYGLASILCSYPALPGRSILKRYDSQHPFISLPEILLERGYTNIFFYSGDFAFDNMEGFFRQKGYTVFVGEESFAFGDEFSKWGVPDHILFNAINKSLDTLPRPFQLTALTLSNHEPFDLPDSSTQRFFDNSEQSKKNNSIIYADWAIGQFMNEAKTHPVFDSTIFVFVSDHCLLENSKMSLNPELFRVPLLICAPKLINNQGTRVTTYGAHIDILPTLMGILGEDYTHESWGRDLLNLPNDDSGFVMLNLWDRIGYLDNSYFYYEQLGQYSKFYSNNNRVYTEIPYDSTNASVLDRIQLLHRISQLADQMTLPVER